MRDHIKILGILNIILGSLTALVGVVALIAMGSIAGFIAASLASGGSDSQDSAVAAPIVASIGLAVAVFFFVLGLPAIIGGWGLMRYRPWSRVLMIIVSIFHLFHIPLGTALGAYGLWVLLSDETRRILQSGGLIAAAPAYGTASYPDGRASGSAANPAVQSYGPPPPGPPSA